VNLGPLRDALLEDARAKAAAELAEAAGRATRQREAAESEGAAVVERARAEGAAAADAENAAQQALARRQARALVLAARNDVYEELRRRARTAAHDLRGTPDYRALQERLAATARSQLGADARLELDPPGGGVVATSGTRRVDYSLDALVERCIELLGSRAERLWA
jgi:hypothetical protein